jgi:hypothetical protein
MDRNARYSLWLVAAMSGCSPATHEVHGQVTLDGAVVPDAQIQFISSDEKLGPSFVRGDQDGQYRIRLPRGDYTVRIVAQKWAPAPPGKVGYNGRPIEKVLVDLLPEKYNDNSELRATVIGTAQLDFKLTAESP